MTETANFTFTTQNKPSIFDVIAQKSLDNTLYPAIQKIALFFSTNYPKYFNWLGNYYDESFLFINILLQYHYLKYYDATFSENFYSLRRILLENNRNLTNRHKDVSLLCAVVLPYIKRKFDDKIANYKLEEADGCLSNNFDSKFKKFLILCHSTSEIIWTIITIHQYLKYMSNGLDAQLPILQIIGLKLDYDTSNQDLNFWSAIFRGQINSTGFGFIKNTITCLLEVLAFFMQFLQSWNAKHSNYDFKALSKVQPPAFDVKARNYDGKCPICLQNWKIPTVLPVSGYVFCFSCILRYLLENQKCPVTSLPARPLDVIRIFDG